MPYHEAQACARLGLWWRWSDRRGWRKLRFCRFDFHGIARREFRAEFSFALLCSGKLSAELFDLRWTCTGITRGCRARR